MSRLGFVATLYLGTLSTTMLGGFALVDQWPFWWHSREGEMVLDKPIPTFVRQNPQFAWHDVDVLYRTAQGDVHVAGKHIPADMVAVLDGGGSVPVRFLADDPQRARFYDDSGPILWIWFVLAVVLGATARLATRMLKREAGYLD